MRTSSRFWLGVLAAGAVVFAPTVPASAHVVPSTTIELDVHEEDITASLTLPLADLVTASSIDVATEGAIGADTADSIATYVEDHFQVSTDEASWQVAVEDVALAEVEQWGTGAFPAVTAVATLTPPRASDLRTFVLDYDAIIHQVVTADIFVTLHSDWAAGEAEAARDLGTITLDTRSGTVAPLPVDLDDGSAWQGFLGMLSLGVSHIAEGTDHQLFLLTLLLPAPLIAVAGRWRGVAPPGRTVRRITTVTVAFTLGHSLTLALGAIGLPVPTQPIEVLIALSILVAAFHAIRPIFPGREAVVAGLFGLIHGMAFSGTLTALDLSGFPLAVSLLGFNLGIEIMQLAVVLVVLPPLVLLARTRIYTPLRVTATCVTGAAAVGWVIDRLGAPNPLASAADTLGVAAPYIAVALWLLAIGSLLRQRRRVSGRMPQP